MDATLSSALAERYNVTIAAIVTEVACKYRDVVTIDECPSKSLTATRFIPRAIAWDALLWRRAELAIDPLQAPPTPGVDRCARLKIRHPDGTATEFTCAPRERDLARRLGSREIPIGICDDHFGR